MRFSVSLCSSSQLMCPCALSLKGGREGKRKNPQREPEAPAYLCGSECLQPARQDLLSTRPKGHSNCRLGNVLLPCFPQGGTQSTENGSFRGPALWISLPPGDGLVQARQELWGSPRAFSRVPRGKKPDQSRKGEGRQNEARGRLFYPLCLLPRSKPSHFKNFTRKISQLLATTAS